MARATARVSLTSDLKRKGWMQQGLLQAASKSFWAPMSGSSMDAVVYIAKNGSGKEGHTVVFDWNGNLVGKPIAGREEAYGKGESKRKFSDKLTVGRFRMVVNNGDKFDGVDINDLNLTQHSDSRTKLSDLYMRVKDQAIFDVAQGLAGQAPTHTIELEDFDYNSLLDIEHTLRTSQGFTGGAIRRPLNPYTMSDGRPAWMFVMDSAMATKLKKSDKYQALVFNADVRGNKNRAFHGVFGKIGQLMLVEAGNFFGATDKTGVISMQNTNVEMCGMRQQDSNSVWTGQPGFDYALKLKSRGLILGAGAIQLGMGKQPDYMYQPSQDFKIDSESAVEWWMGVKKTKLFAEDEDYEQAKVAGIDHGIVTVDTVVKEAG